MLSRSAILGRLATAAGRTTPLARSAGAAHGLLALPRPAVVATATCAARGAASGRRSAVADRPRRQNRPADHGRPGPGRQGPTGARGRALEALRQAIEANDLDAAMTSYMFLVPERALRPRDVADVLRVAHQTIRFRRSQLKQQRVPAAAAEFANQIGCLDILVDDLCSGRTRVGSQGLVHALSAYKEALAHDKAVELFGFARENFALDAYAGSVYGAMIEVEADRRTGRDECEMLFHAAQAHAPTAVLYQALIYARLVYGDVAGAVDAFDELKTRFDDDIVARREPRVFNHFIGLCPDPVVAREFLHEAARRGFRIDPSMLILHMHHEWDASHNFDAVYDAFLLYVNHCDPGQMSATYPAFDLTRLLFDAYPRATADGIARLREATQLVLSVFNKKAIPHNLFNDIVRHVADRWKRPDICDVLVEIVARAGFDRAVITHKY
ncbi:uncharacterized protein V1510DRAFT_118979 [Dipodascopsis tothii]|uniref:uncharacterized protein n=1 Tax=Dipodascopsis tothii TaxID=44089 RepID=UPI0034CFEA80